VQSITIPSKAFSRFGRTLRVSQTWLTLPTNMVNDLSGRRNYSARTHWKLTINNITQ
jgi:hypothetical protein